MAKRLKGISPCRINGIFEHRVVQFANGLCRYSMSDKVALNYAYGCIFQIMRHGWINCDDIIGDGGEVDKILDSPLPPNVISRLMHHARLLGKTKGCYYCSYIFSDCPSNIKTDWRRKSRETYDAAKKRANVYAKHNAVKTEAEQEKVFTDLFGEPIDADIDPVTGKPYPIGESGGSSYKGIPGHKDLVAYFCEEWGSLHKQKYPFAGGRDGKIIKSILQGTRDLPHAKQVIDAYLNCKDRFYLGHPLKKLLSDLPRFIAAANNISLSGNDNIPYEGTDDELPEL